MVAAAGLMAPARLAVVMDGTAAAVTILVPSLGCYWGWSPAHPPLVIVLWHTTHVTGQGNASSYPCILPFVDNTKGVNDLSPQINLGSAANALKGTGLPGRPV